MKHYLYAIIIVFLLAMSTLRPDITTLEGAIEVIKHLDDLKEQNALNVHSADNATALNELKKYILNDDSLTQEEIEILLENIADLETESATEGSTTDEFMVETRKKLKSKRFACLLARNLTVCNNTVLNNLVVNGSFDICGVPACSLAAGYALLATATSADIPDTLVLRDGGSFAATTITLTGVLALQGTNGNTIDLQACPATTNYTLILPCDPGSAGQVLATTGSNPDQTFWTPITAIVTSTIQLYGDVIGSTSATQVKTVCGVPACNLVATYSTVLSATSGNVCGTLVLRDSNCNFSANLITATVTNALLSVTAQYVQQAGSANFAFTSSVAQFANTASFALTSSAALTAVTSTSANYFTGQLYGDVIGTQAATQVVSVCGVPACDLVNINGTQTINGLKTFNNTVNIAAQNALDFYDATNTHFVGLQAPLSVATTYTLSFPAGLPGAGQFLVTSTVAPFTALNWGNVGGVSAQTIYVATNGSDTTGDGSFGNPYASLKKAISVANNLAAPTHPIQITIGAGIFTEDNSSGPLTVNPVTPGGLINIVGASTATTILKGTTPSQNFLALPVSVSLRSFTITLSNPFSSGIGVVATGAGNNSIFIQLKVQACGQGFNLSGGPTSVYFFEGSAVTACGTGVTINNAHALIYNQTFLGTTSSPTPMFPGLIVTGSASLVAVESPSVLYCTTGLLSSGTATVQIVGGSITGNNIGVQCETQSQTTINGVIFAFNNNSNISVQDLNTTVQATSCNINGLSLLGGRAGTGLQVINGAIVNIASSSFNNLVDGIITGSPTETSAATLLATGVTIQNSANQDIIQNASSTLAFAGGAFSDGKITINTPGNAAFNAADIDSNYATLIGQFVDQTQDIIIVGTSENNAPALTYQHDYNGATGLVYINQTGDTTVFGVETTTANDAQLSAVTVQNTQASSVQLYSGNIGNVPGSPPAGNINIRGWELKKTSGNSIPAAALEANFMNNDLSVTPTISKYTSFYVDGFANTFNFPAVNTTYLPTYTTTRLIWGQDSPSTNLYRAATSLLQTDGKFAIGTLGASSSGFALTAASPSNIIQVSPTTAAQIGYLQNVTSDVQAQINGKLSLTGGVMTGALTLPQSTSPYPPLNFGTAPGSTTGLAAPGGVLTLVTSGSPRLLVDANGGITINAAIGETTLTVTGGGASISGNLTIQPGTGRIITDAITINNAPVNGTDGTNKAYVDSIAVGLSVKTPCLLVATAPDGNIDISGATQPTIDGVLTQTGERILLTDQTNGVQNGIWVTNFGSPWGRPTDFPSGGSAANAYTLITQGAVYANSSWICTNTIGNATIDTNTLVWTEFTSPQNITGANVGGTAGVFRDKTGNTLNFRSLNNGGNPNISVTQNTNDITIALSNSPSISSLQVSGQVTAGTLSDGAGTSITGGTVSATNIITSNGTAANPSISFINSSTTGLFSPSANTLAISTAGVERLQIDNSGTIKIPAFSTAGVVHNDNSGNLFSSGLITSDFSNANVVPNSALQTLTMPGLVANSATSATSSNILNTIVLRDSLSGGFYAGIVTVTTLLAGDGSDTVPSIGFANHYSANGGPGLSSPLTGQLNLISGTGAGAKTQIILTNGNNIQLPLLLPSLPLQLDASNNVFSGQISLASGVSGVLPIANGGTNSGTALFNNRIMVSSGGSIVESAALNNGQILIGSTSAAPVVANITQNSPNQVIVANGPGSITLSTPQNIDTNANVQFRTAFLNAPSNQLILGTGNNVTLDVQSLTQSHTYYFPDVTATSTFVMVDGAQTINGLKTFNNTVNLAAQNQIDFYDAANAHLVGLRAPTSITSNYTLQLPTAQGGTNQVLANDGSGNLSWVTTVTSQASINLLNTATSCDVANTLVLRDNTGSFVATTITLTGNSLINYGTSSCSAGSGFIFAPTNQNTIIGLNAGNSNKLTGTSNVVLGYDALMSVTSGFDNIAIGAYALQKLQGGVFNGVFVPGADNIAIGTNALANSQFDILNIAIGTQAMGNTNSSAGGASSNIAIGFQAMLNNSASNNIGIGAASLLSTLSPNNIAMGINAVKSNISGSFNIGIGNTTLFSNVSGSNNTALGHQADVNGSPNAQNRTALGYNTQAPFDNGVALGNNSVTSVVSTNNRNVNLGVAPNNIWGTLNTVTAAFYDNSNATNVTLSAPATLSNSYNLLLPVSQAQGQYQVLANISLPGTTEQLGWITTVTNSTQLNWLNTATSCDYPLTLVLRDSTGSFAATTITLTGELLLQNANGNYTALQAGAQNIGNPVYTLILPTTLGSNNQVLTTDGNNPAQLSWATVMTNTNQLNLLYTATSCDYPLTLVLRDSTGSFAATTITLTGNSLINYGTSSCSTGSGFVFAPLNQNTLIGLNANSNNPLAGTNNTALGNNALQNNQGSYCIAIGSGALVGNNFTTALASSIAIGALSQNVASGNAGNNVSVGLEALNNVQSGAARNTAVGNYAGQTSTGATDSVAVGYNSLLTNAGSFNTGVGNYSLVSINTGANNTAVGGYSLNANPGSNNTALGFGSAGLSGNSTSNNLAVGYYALGNANNTASNLTAVGYYALFSNTSGTQNTALGYYALEANTTNGNNTAVGYQAMQNANSLVGNSVAVGVNTLTQDTGHGINVAMGVQAMQNAAPSLGFDVAVGYLALQKDIAGQNTAVGAQALSANTSGTGNTALGFLAMSGGTGANFDVAVGTNTLSLDSGGSNVAVGAYASAANTSGASNVSVGYYALKTNTSGSANTAIGYNALNSVSAQSNNIAVGYNTLSGASILSDNIAIGVNALSASGNTQGQQIAIGTNALQNNTTGFQNTAVGYQALSSLTTSTANTAMGYKALASVTTQFGGHVAVGSLALTAVNKGGQGNTAIGASALTALTTGSVNTAVGFNAGSSVTTGTANVIVGAYAGTSVSGSNNIIVGASAGTGSSYNANNNTIVGAYSATSLSTGGNNTIVGYQALVNNATGTDNTAIGFNALNAATRGYSVAVGSNALSQNTTSTTNIGIGYYALNAITTGNRNVGMGYYALQSTGATINDDIAIGYYALQKDTSGTNIAIGTNALSAATSSANNNIAIGNLSMGSLTGANNNIGIGIQTLQNMSSNSQNIAIGNFSQQNVTSGNGNVSMGHNVLNAVTTGASNVAIGGGGIGAGAAATAIQQNVLIGNGVANNAAFNSSNSVAVGYSTLQKTTDPGCVAIGAFALQNYTTAGGANPGNIAIGYYAQNANDTGDRNIAIGYYALRAINGGSSENIAIGYYAQNSGNGSNNVMIGLIAGEAAAGSSNVIVGNSSASSASFSSSANTIVGNGAAQGLTTGGSNLIIGQGAGNKITAGVNNILIGTGVQSGSSSNNISNSIIIGNPNAGFIAGTSGAIQIGYYNNGASSNTSCYIDGINGIAGGGAQVFITSGGQLNTNASSMRYKKQVVDMLETSTGIYQLRPVNFYFNQDLNNEHLEYGLIAEEVEDIYPDIVIKDKDGLPQNIQYHYLPMMMLNEQLKDHAELLQYKQRIAALEEQNRAMQAQLADLQAKIEKLLA